jgi:hypothetical protein
MAKRRKKGSISSSLRKLAAEGRKVQVMGSVKNGKLQLDHKALTAMVKRFPNARISFVAVNAPFKTKEQAAA